MAATYLFHIIKNHPFVDGNKRTALITTITFLELNGFEDNYEFESLYELTISVANSNLMKEQIAHFFREHHNKKILK